MSEARMPWTPERETRGESRSGALPQNLDGGVLTAALALLLLGIVMSYSTTAPLSLDSAIPPLFLAHLLAVVAGFAGALALSQLPLSFWKRAAPVLWGIGLALLVATHWFGTSVNGAQRWIETPGLGFRFQPAELVKCATLLAVAAAISARDGRRELSDRRAVVAMCLLAPPVALLLLQPDLGSAVLLSTLVALLLIVAGTPLRRLVLPGLCAGSGVAAYVYFTPYAMRRMTGFLDPWSESQGAGFQLIQSFVAFGNGGLAGAGLGNGRQKLFYLPEAHTDFILAVVAEELGLIGVLVVLAAFSALLYFGCRIARRATDRFALLAAFGMTGLLTLPAAINAAVVMGVLPTKGLTLPFLSYGRTSLLMCCVALGILLGISRTQGEAARANGRSPARRRT